MSKPFFLWIYVLYFPTAIVLQNIDEIGSAFVFSWSFFSIVISSFVVAALFFGLSYAVVQDVRKSLCSAAIFLLLFNNYGPVHRFLSQFWEAGPSSIIGPNKVIYVLFGTLGVTILYFFKKKDKIGDSAIKWLNAFCICLLFIPAIRIVMYNSSSVIVSVNHIETGEKFQERPDVYYIIPDAFARADVLKDVYNQESKEFVSAMRAKGFYIAEKASSNWQTT